MCHFFKKKKKNAPMLDLCLATLGLDPHRHAYRGREEACTHRRHRLGSHHY
jgi:hypothetical protein